MQNIQIVPKIETHDVKFAANCSVSGVLVVLSWCAYGQASTVRGRVIGSGETIRTAVVTLTRIDSGWKRFVLTDQQGRFSISTLLSGHYRLEALKPGFKLASPKIVDVHSNQTLAVELRMEKDNASNDPTFEVSCAPAGNDDGDSCGIALARTTTAPRE